MTSALILKQVNRHQSGFGLIEAVVALAILAGITLAYSQIALQRTITEVNGYAAQHAIIIQSGVNKFINDNRLTLLQTPTPVIAGFANVYAPTMSELQTVTAGKSYLLAGYDAANLLGMSYAVTISRLPAGCTPGVSCTDVTGLIMSTAPLIDPATGLAAGTRLGDIALTVGVDAAYSREGYGTTLLGANGVWGSVPNPAGNLPGMLAMRVGFGSMGYGNLDYLLPRDGSRPMTGDLSLGGNSITNINNMTATGKAKADSFVTTTKTVGAPCTDSGALASGTDVLMVCRSGSWQVVGPLGTDGAPCVPNGQAATSSATGEGLVCRGGVYIKLLSALPKFVEMARQVVTDGSVVPKPPCDAGGTSTFRLGMTQTAVDVSTAPPKQVTQLTAINAGGSWNVSYKLKDDMGTLYSANAYNLSAIIYLECNYP